MPDADDAAADVDEAPAPSRRRRAQVPAELRERIRTLDGTERRLSYAAAAATALMAGVLIPFLLHKTTTFQSEPLKNHHCLYRRYPGEPPGCHLAIIHVPADYVPYFVALVVLAIVVLVGAIRNRRTLVAFSTLLGGLAVTSSLSPIIGILLLFFGGWLMVRAWRLQRYGASDAKTVRKVAADRADQRRAQRQEARTTGAAAPSPTGRTKVAPSKRYTPAKRRRRR